MYRVHGPSRLHFGFLSFPTPDANVRRYGGAGLMIDRPGIRLVLEPARQWSADGPGSERALEFAKLFGRALGAPMANDQPVHITVEECGPEHSGLGTGTQLGLAVARAMAAALGHCDLDAPALARLIGRGRRSALGIHGFDRGGFLVEAGKGPRTTISPLVARMDFPDDWGIVLVLPEDRRGLHGLSEANAFDRLQGRLAAPDRRAQDQDVLSRLVLLGLLPALVEHDLEAFGECLYEFNRRNGEVFRPFQDGIYAGARGEAVVDFIRRQGAAGVGQSSWGPAIFAITALERAAGLADQIRKQFGLQPQEVLVTKGTNQGAQLQK